MDAVVTKRVTTEQDYRFNELLVASQTTEVFCKWSHDVEDFDQSKFKVSVSLFHLVALL